MPLRRDRIKILQRSLRTPVLIKKKENLFYLTGRSFDYRAEEYLLVTKSHVVGFGSGLENIDWVKKSDRLKNIGKYGVGKKLSLEWGFTFGEAEYLKYKAPKIKAKPERSPVDEMRQVKDESELSNIRKSMQIVGRVFDRIKHGLRSRVWTERALADFITKTGYKFGAEDISFPAIVASGPNAAIPHHVPSNKKLKAGESIIIDFGFKYKNYCSDFTRTVFLKHAPKKLADAYNQTEKAYNESIIFAKAGVEAGKVYDKSVAVLKEKKLDKYFIHSLGHGTGLEIHELPNLSPGSKDILKDNMVFSIEPGVYIKNLGGIRIEDLVYLKSGRAEKFISIPTKIEKNVF
jgi:Xaa-Pro aminopeptidase